MAEIAAAFQSFEFRQCTSIIKSTGKKARSLRELRAILSVVSDESVFHHTYQYFLKGHILEYTNDFAHWAGQSLEERALAERLSNIDPYDFKNIGELRRNITDVIDDYLVRFPTPREAMQGDEFYFNEPLTIIFPAGIAAKNLAEFLIGIKYVDGACIYYHFYEARMRLGEGVDDFSRWFEGTLGKIELAETIRTIDPFMHNIEGIRGHIAEAVEETLRKDMESAEG